MKGRLLVEAIKPGEPDAAVLGPISRSSECQMGAQCGGEVYQDGGEVTEQGREWRPKW